MVKVFISHSSVDSELAGHLAELFRSALSLSAKDIRCTSVDGYRLPAGANTDEQLRREVLEAQVLAGILSHASFESAYVLFELGARWGKNEYLIPVLAPGETPSILKGPISNLNALMSTNQAQMHQLVSDVAGELGIRPERTEVFHNLVEGITSLRPVRKGVRNRAEADGNQAENQNVSGHDVAEDYSGAETIIAQRCREEWPDDFEMQAYCEEKQRKALAKLRQPNRTDVPEDVFLMIRKKAVEKWPDDFEMQQHEEQNQLEAYKKLYHSGSV